MPEMSLDHAIYIVDHIDDYIENALANEVADVAKEAISLEVTDGIVYGYDKVAPVFFASRRGGDDGSGGIADREQMEEEAVGCLLTITDNAQLQDLWPTKDTPSGWQADVADIVQRGDKQFNQPHPRPFMEEGVTKAIYYGDVQRALQVGLERQHVDVD